MCQTSSQLRMERTSRWHLDESGKWVNSNPEASPPTLNHDHYDYGNKGNRGNNKGYSSNDNDSKKKKRQ